jgi:ubiquitin-protein ligase
MKQSTVNRLTKELAELSSNPPDNSTVSIVGDNLAHWALNVVGPVGTPYEGGSFQLSIVVPDTYPFKPPEIKFVTRIYHPNVKTEDGSICADVYQTNWAPTLNIRFVIEAILSILMQPNADTAVEPEIAQLMLSDEAAYLASARDWTQRYARALA